MILTASLALVKLQLPISLCDLAIIGGGFTGLRSALKSRERYPDAKIVLPEAQLCGKAASGQNGGFCAPSISHGASNALARWPHEADTLNRLGRENLQALTHDLDNYQINAEFKLAGKLNVAATTWQIKICTLWRNRSNALTLQNGPLSGTCSLQIHASYLQYSHIGIPRVISRSLIFHTLIKAAYQAR